MSGTESERTLAGHRACPTIALRDPDRIAVPAVGSADFDVGPDLHQGE